VFSAGAKKNPSRRELNKKNFRKRGKGNTKQRGIQKRNNGDRGGAESVCKKKNLKEPFQEKEKRENTIRWTEMYREGGGLGPGGRKRKKLRGRGTWRGKTHR